MHTILGAGGAIGNGLAEELARAQQRVRLVGRNPALVWGATATLSADLTDAAQALRAVEGSDVVYLVVGLKYDLKVWRTQWPRIMRNVIDACKRTQAKLIFFDNVYMYGKVEGRMTEETPFNPCSRKGEVRAQIATTLLDEIKAGNLTAMIARSADFYGSAARTSVANILVFNKFANRSTASWLVNDAVPHAFTYTPDAARALALLAASDTAWNKTWHLPTAANPPTGKQFIEMTAEAFGVEPKYRILGRAMIGLAGLFSSDIRESAEMLYQSEAAYVFDSSKFTQAFGVEPTTYAAGVAATAAAYRKT